ncbi:adenylate/guanylate cyclase domain-containing protein, partial [Streptomyces anulatus]
APRAAPPASRERGPAQGAARPTHEPPLPTYRFGLQPMWQRPVRGLGVVEPWLLARRGKTGS